MFDRAFLDRNEKRFPIENGRSATDLDFGSVIYLQDSPTISDFPELNRKCRIFGSPWTPKYVDSAFQYERTHDIWANKIPEGIDILLTHGPPYGHWDGHLHAGCPYLAYAIEKKSPKLIVFGHIHAGYGREVIKLDRLRRVYEDIERGWSGWEAIPVMLLFLVWSMVSAAFMSVLGLDNANCRTEFINAAVVDENAGLSNEPIVTYI